MLGLILWWEDDSVEEERNMFWHIADGGPLFTRRPQPLQNELRGMSRARVGFLLALLVAVFSVAWFWIVAVGTVARIKHHLVLKSQSHAAVVSWSIVLSMTMVATLFAVAVYWKSVVQWILQIGQ